MIFAREPIPGEVKTRLHPILGPEGAASLYRVMLEDVVDRHAADPSFSLHIAYTPASGRSFFERLARGRARLHAQRGGSLGERLRETFARLFESGFVRVVVRNSDSPHLPGRLVQAAFAALRREAEVCLGPDLGGGYYLVGMCPPLRDIFEGVPMSAERTLDRTRERACALGLRTFLLEPFGDVDDACDLEALWKWVERRPDRCPRTAEWLRIWKGRAAGR